MGSEDVLIGRLMTALMTNPSPEDVLIGRLMTGTRGSG